MGDGEREMDMEMWMGDGMEASMFGLIYGAL